MANSARNIETVRPIPAKAPAPAISLKVSESGLRANPIFTASQAKSVMPIILPRMRPKIIPPAMGLEIV